VSWDDTRYEATCQQCGRAGFVTRSSDDWGRSRTNYEGFENLPPDINDVARKRADARESRPRCSCGSTSVIQGAQVG
jgi:hypothetical protein